MSDGKWRAGPWADSSSAYLAPETDFTSEPSKYPVNPNTKNWTNQDWSMVYVKFDDDFVSAGTADIDETVAISGAVDGVGALIDAHFYYVAGKSFDLDFNWLVDNPSNFGSWSWEYSSIEGDSDSDSDFSLSATSGTETITLPASRLCKVKLTVSTDGFDGDISLSASES